MALLQVKGRNKVAASNLSPYAQASIVYHDIFDYPLTEGQLIKWELGKASLRRRKITKQFVFKNGFYFISGHESLVFKRIIRERNYFNKLNITRKAGNILKIIPGVRGAFVTGALAMNNADRAADVDLLIVAKKGQLWTSRLVTLLIFRLIGFPLRKAGYPDQKDELCLNMWLDESSLGWPKKKRNLFSAHEIAQITPIVNKGQIYERFLYSNRWLKRYWPNAVKIQNPKSEIRNKLEFSIFKHLNIVLDLVLRASNSIAFKLQYLYMRRKITKEVVSASRAIFHPNDLEAIILTRFKSYFV